MASESMRSGPLDALPMPRAHFIGLPDRFLFTWHHAPTPAASRRAAVVLCPPLGFEYICAYRAWRILAERLCALGFDVIRFDYLGTGDSAGDPEDPGALDAWLRSIEDATTVARRIVGSNEVALVGLRLGATLAVQAAAAMGGVRRLVLWSPFRSGRAYVRELKAFACLSRDDHVPETSADGDIYAAGHVLTRSTAQELGRLDLGQLSIRPAPDVLIVDRDDRVDDTQLHEQLEKLGSAVARCRPAGTADMLVQPALSRAPEQVHTAVVSWLSDWHCADTQPAGTGDTRRVDGASSSCAIGTGYREQPVRFGPAKRLVGILTSPATQNPAAPAIVFLTTGAEYHVGPNRLYVPLARSWAAAGHPVLRYDLGGIGDSLPPPGAAENVAYPAHALDDAREALALIRSEAPGHPVIVIGLCSGGWHSFRAALEGLPVDAIVAINPPLYLREGSSGKRRANEDDEVRRYQRLLRNRSSWAKALRGRAAYGTALRLALGSYGRKLLARVNEAAGGRLLDGIVRDLDAISARGIASLLVFSRGDNGLNYFQLRGGTALRARRLRRHVQHVIIDGADHTFRPPEAQRALKVLLMDFVAKQTSATGAARSDLHVGSSRPPNSKKWQRLAQDG